MRTMYDSVDASAIPTTATIVAGYVDGAYVWTEGDWARFPRATKVRIAVFATTHDGHVLDVEQGNATPDQAPGWVLGRRAYGIDPTVYCSLSAWTTLRNAFIHANVAAPHWWVAHYNGVEAVPVGAVAAQYADDIMLGKHYDLSAVADYWPGVDPLPHSSRKDDTMLHLVKVKGDATVWIGDRITRRKVKDDAELADLSWDLRNTDGYTEAQASLREVDDLDAFGVPLAQ